MLQIELPEQEIFNEETSEITIIKGQRLSLEHSLVSLSKWESKWETPFLGKREMTNDQLLDYIRCMTITQNVDPKVYLALSQENLNEIEHYINRKMTATWFSNQPTSSGRGEVVTSEIIYYWMITLGIPVEFQKWHLNRLLTFIKVVSLKNSPKKKMSRRELAQRNSALNAQRIHAKKSGRG